MSKIEIVIKPATVRTFVGSYSGDDGAHAKRAQAVRDVLKHNRVGEKGGASQNGALKALESAIRESLGEDANTRTGWAYANLGNYARIVAVAESIGARLTGPVVRTLYAAQNAARQEWQDALKNAPSIADATTEDEKDAAAVAVAAALVNDVKSAKDAKRAADAAERAAAKEAAESAPAVVKERQTPAAFVESIRENIDAERWTLKERGQLSRALAALAADVGTGKVGALDMSAEAVAEAVAAM